MPAIKHHTHSDLSQNLHFLNLTDSGRFQLADFLQCLFAIGPESLGVGPGGWIEFKRAVMQLPDICRGAGDLRSFLLYGMSREI